MYCPLCRAEYRVGFTECSDCRVPLVAELPTETEPSPEFEPPRRQPGDAADVAPEFVEVLQCDDSLAVALARGTLDDAGILYLLNNKIPLSVTGDRASLWLAMPCSIKVGHADEKRARALLEPLAKR